MKKIFKGKVWKFGDCIDSGNIKGVMAGIDPDFHKKVQLGDVIVAGINFGMGSSAEDAPRSLRDAGVERMYGLPGGEILAFIEAARKVGIEFVLVRHEAVAAFMADVSGQIARKPAICVSTLGPGAEISRISIPEEAPLHQALLGLVSGPKRMTCGAPKRSPPSPRCFLRSSRSKRPSACTSEHS